jgi:hypothetical protein
MIYDIPEGGQVWPKCAVLYNNKNKFMKYDSVAIILQPLNTYESCINKIEINCGNHLLLSNGSENTFTWRCDSWINNPLLGETYNNT